LVGTCGLVSTIGISRGAPKVAHDDEKTSACTPASSIARSSCSVPTVMFW